MAHLTAAVWIGRASLGAFLLLLWEIAVRLEWIDPLFLASPTQVANVFPGIWSTALTHLVSTLSEFTLAVTLAVLAGVAAGFLVGSSPHFYQLLGPIAALGVVIPKVTLIPLFLLWFGLGKSAIVFYGFLSGFFPVFLNSMAGVREVKPSYLVAARAMGCAPWEIGLKVVLPAAMPVLVSGIFMGSVQAMIGLLIMEMAMARYGLGAWIYSLAVNFKTAELYGAVVITVAVSLSINLSLYYLSERLSVWRG
ncbi:MAG: ABC transporter permease subunit [Deltaproteobacteria bacterium]|nr:ABC transporter permease subunit [Deltaproteobacteria bacterium]